MNDETKKASLRESQPVTTLATPTAFSPGSWTESGFVYYGRLLSQEIRRVPSSGGTPEVVADLAGNAGNLRCVEVLPGEAAILATIGGSVRLVNVQDGSHEAFLDNAVCPRYASSGHLVFGRGNTLFAVAFDPENFTMKGSPVPVLEGVDMTRGAGTTTDRPLQFAFSRTGHLFYVPQWSRDIQIVRVDRAGKTEPLLEIAGQYSAPAVSPDGDAIAVQDAASDLWILEWERDVLRRVTFDPGSESRPIWTPDGEHLTYFSVQDGGPSFEWIRSDGVANAKCSWSSETSRSARRARRTGLRTAPCLR